jgi:hypothetical protein
MLKPIAILVLFLSFMNISYADELKLKGADNDLAVILDNSPTVANFIKGYSQAVKAKFDLPTKKIGKHVIADLLKYTKVEDKKLLITAPVLGPGFDLFVKYYDFTFCRSDIVSSPESCHT